MGMAKPTPEEAPLPAKVDFDMVSAKWQQGRSAGAHRILAGCEPSLRCSTGATGQRQYIISEAALKATMRVACCHLWGLQWPCSHQSAYPCCPAAHHLSCLQPGHQAERPVLPGGCQQTRGARWAAACWERLDHPLHASVQSHLSEPPGLIACKGHMMGEQLTQPAIGTIYRRRHF